MAGILRRSLAPLTEEAWREVDEAASRILKHILTARTLVDFEGPYGLDYAAVNTGHLDVKSTPGPHEVPWGLREAHPLVETRQPAVLNQLELDNITRGARDSDLQPLEDAARRIALFEETAIYEGFADGRIEGIAEASTHDPIELPENAEDYPNVLAEALAILRHANIKGPYALVLDLQHFKAVSEADQKGFPVTRALNEIIPDGILWSEGVSGGLVLSRRGGDFQMTVGQDLAVGYAHHDKQDVELYLTESFTFRTLEPAAAVSLKPA